MGAPLYGTSLILGKIRKNQRPKVFSGEVRQIDLVSTFCFLLLANEEYPGGPPLLDCFIWRVNFNLSPQLGLHILEFIYARILSTSRHASGFAILDLTLYRSFNMFSFTLFTIRVLGTLANSVEFSEAWQCRCRK